MRTLPLIPLLLLAGCAADPSLSPETNLRTASSDRPAYQRPFFTAAHQRPTPDSRTAAERQMRELLAAIRTGAADPWRLANDSVLPDARFDPHCRREPAFAFAMPGLPNGAELTCTVYALPAFRATDGTRVINPRPEIWYVLPGESKIRKTAPDRLRYVAHERGFVRPAYPGSPEYVRAHASIPAAMKATAALVQTR